MYVACSGIHLLPEMCMELSPLSKTPIFTSIMPAPADKLRLVLSSSSRMSTLSFQERLDAACCITYHIKSRSDTHILLGYAIMIKEDHSAGSFAMSIFCI